MSNDQQVPQPHSALKRLERFAGSWSMEGHLVLRSAGRAAVGSSFTFVALGSPEGVADIGADAVKNAS